MNTDNLRDFIKYLFTLRTVWIDKGRGRWAVKKRLHPVLRGIFCTAGVVLCGVVYAAFQNPRFVEAETHSLTAQTPPEIIAPVEQSAHSGVITASLPEPENLPVVAAAFHGESPAPPVRTDQSIIIPLTTRKSTASSFQLPSEMNPETDRIITVQREDQRREDPRREAPPVWSEPVAPVTPKTAKNGRYNIRVNKSEYTLTLYKGDEFVKSYPIAVGKNPGDKQRVGDNRTPTGNFKIVSIENASKWTHDFRDGKGKIAGAYGPWFLRLDAKGWKGIGIHGTHDPDSRGTMATEGCIRLSNEDIAELKTFAYKNMPVVIREN